MSDPVDPGVIGTRLIQHSHDVQFDLREHSPVRRVCFPDGTEGWLVTRYEDVKAISSDPRISRDADGIAKLERAHADADPDGGYGWMFRNIIYLDPPDHTRLRKLVSKAFAPRVVDQLSPRIEEIADDLLSGIAAQGIASQEGVDLMATFAAPLPRTVICELLGIPESDRPDFAAWSDVVNGADPRADRVGTLRHAADYLSMLTERKQAEPGPDLLSHMAVASEDGDRLSRAELIAMTVLMLLAGQDTTANLIGNGVLAFLQAPGQHSLVRSDPRLLPNAIEEILRYDCPVNVSTARFTLQPIVLGGVEIPAGNLLYPSMLSANRDARQFANPDAFDITREAGGHLGFGHGIHYCLGAPLARLEGRIALGKLFARFPRLRLAVTPDALAYRDSTLLHGLVRLPVHVM